MFRRIIWKQRTLVAGASRRRGSDREDDGARRSSGRPWAPAANADITPGVATYTENGQCTTNFVFIDDAGNTYVGQSAHCDGTGESKEADGCTSGSLPLGTPVTFNRSGSPLSDGEVIATGELAYSSWISMQQLGDKDINTCAYNDFALVKVGPDDVGKVNPSVRSGVDPLTSTPRAPTRVTRFSATAIRVFGSGSPKCRPKRA